MNLMELEDFFYKVGDNATFELLFCGKDLYTMVSAVSRQLYDFGDEITKEGRVRAVSFLKGREEPEYYLDHVDDDYELDLSGNQIGIILTSIGNCFSRNDFSPKVYQQAHIIIDMFIDIVLTCHEYNEFMDDDIWV